MREDEIDVEWTNEVYETFCLEGWR